MITFVLAAILSLYEMLWVLIEKEHPDLYAKYDFVNEGEGRIGAETAVNVGDHLLVADLDGDKEPDYTLVLVPKDGAGYAILVLLQRTKSQKAVLVIDRADGRAAAVTLRAEAASAGSRRKTLVVATNGRPPRRFQWQGTAQEFREVPQLMSGTHNNQMQRPAPGEVERRR